MLEVTFSQISRVTPRQNSKEKVREWLERLWVELYPEYRPRTA